MMPESSRPARLVFLDVLRLLAAVQMIQGHSVASVLDQRYRSGPAFEVWAFARGLTSVVFLATAGLSFVLAEQRASDMQARRHRTRRAAMLIALGYLMHAPLGVLLGAPVAQTLRAAIAVDVLQCIGVSLLLLELLCLALPGVRARVYTAAVLSASAFAAAPLLQDLRTPSWALPLGNYLSTQGGSLFPLSPWAGFVLAGFALGSVVLRRPRRLARSLALVGAGLFCLGLLGHTVWQALPRGVSPGYALVKLGCVLLLAGLLAHLLRDVERLPAWLSALSGETLFLYLSHVIILYADGVGLEAHLRGSHTPLFGVLLAVTLLVVCSVAALGLRSLRGRSGSGTRAAPAP